MHNIRNWKRSELKSEKEQWDQKNDLLEWSKKAQLVQPLEQAYLQAGKNLQETQVRLGKLQKWFAVHGQDREKKELQLEKWKEFQKIVYEKQCKNCQALYQAAEARYLKLATDYEQMYQAYFREQAGILAQELKEGIPCPVCGSREHPQKAVLSEHAPNREQVESMKRDRDLAERKREEEQKKLLDSTGKMEQEMAVIREMERQLLGEEKQEVSLEQIRQRWEAWEKKAQERLIKGQTQIDDTTDRKSVV